MIVSQYLSYIQKFFPGVVTGIVSQLNDTNKPLTYRFRTMLTEKFSVTGRYESLNSANTQVTADIVAMDSPLPLKMRDAIGKVNGNIVKMGMRMYLNETQLTDLDTLQAQNGTEVQIAAELFADTKKCINGIYEKLEAMFLEGLSTGVTAIGLDKNTGTEVRLDYGYKSENTFGVATLWSNPASKPFDDIDRVIAKARIDGNVITNVMMDRVTFNNLAKTQQARENYAFTQDFVGSAIKVPTLSQVNTYTTDQYNWTIELVERSVRYEKNGQQTAYMPWATGSVIFLTSTVVGQLVYGRLAAENHPVAGVEYEKAGNFILVSKYRKVEPSLAEFTESQARVVPVIGNVSQIYRIDATQVQA